MNKRVVWLSDMDLKGSGYLNLSIPLCEGLVNKGHEVKVIGLGYRGEEHPYNFSLIPAQNLQEVLAEIQNLYNMWGFDILIVALDIPLQEHLLNLIQNNRPFKYIGIMPIEADPLCMPWAMCLMWMDKPLIISQFGTEEAHKAGVLSAEHIQLGIDTASWKIPSKEEKHAIKKSFGFDDDTFIVLTVADNQERKNLWKGMQIFTEFAKDKDNVKYILVTRENNAVGWRLRNLAQDMGINNKFLVFERGMAFKELWMIYAISDVFLLPSKAEGLGLPLLEAMSTGLVCMATDCTGMKELLSDGRGTLVDYDYVHVDPFGNGKRYWINVEDGAFKLNHIYNTFPVQLKSSAKKARKYAEKRTWNIAVNKLDEAIQKLYEPPQQPEAE